MDDITEDYNRTSDEPKHVVSAEHARQTLEFYASLVGDTSEPPQTVLADLLADLMHYANSFEVDDEDAEEDGVFFDYAVERARDDFEAERPTEVAA